MKIGIISFTARGAQLAHRLFYKWKEQGTDCLAWAPERFLEETWEKEGMLKSSRPLTEWSRCMFQEKRALVFIGAAGIAVRAIAPWLKDKFSDPPVVVVDEGAHFVIPLLSGHVGGANSLARTIAEELGAVPVITTATDVNGLFAVDVFAAKNHLVISDRTEAKALSAGLLAGEQAGFFSDFPYSRLPEHFTEEICPHNLWITVKDKTEQTFSCLRLIPRAVVLGIGCRRGISGECLKAKVEEVLKEHAIDVRAVKAVATIDIKKEEEAIKNLIGDWKLEERFYSAEELKKASGEFHESSFVKDTVGVGNVCERAASLGGGSLIIRKQAGDGITVAAALEMPQLFDTDCLF